MTRFSPLRITRRRLLIALAAIVLICGGAVLAWRRSLVDRGEWPEVWSQKAWVQGPTFKSGSHGGIVYINVQDTRKGINPPRLKWVPLPDAQTPDANDANPRNHQDTVNFQRATSKEN